jgi:hypothetical protein
MPMRRSLPTFAAKAAAFSKRLSHDTKDDLNTVNRTDWAMRVEYISALPVLFNDRVMFKASALRPSGRAANARMPPDTSVGPCIE